jgi:hypothetical protein
VTEAWRTPDQLARGGQLEALGNGLFGLLHGWSCTKQRPRPRLARGNFTEPRIRETPVSVANFSEEKSTAP